MSPLLRIGIKTAAAGWGALFHERRPGILFLIYHRVSGDLPLELDLRPEVFRAKLNLLRNTGTVISYDDALSLLGSGAALDADHFVLTFDDGYRDFHDTVFPILREMGLPAMVFPTTRFVEEGIPHERSIGRDPRLKPLTWEQLGEVAASGLVTIGAHTHSHPDLIKVSDNRIREELDTCIELFRRRIGYRVKHFAYPRALWNERVESLVRERFESAAIGGGRKATAADFDPFRIPRVPVRRSDGLLFFRLRLRGWLEPEERIYELLRRVGGR